MLDLSAVSDGAEHFRAAVARQLRRRRLRWRFYAAGVAAEAGLLLAVARDPLALALLPALALPTLVPILLIGRTRLPNDECENHPDFEGQAAILASCFATHTYQPPGHDKDVQVGVELKTSLRRRFRGLRSRARFAVMCDAEVFLILTARSYWLWYGRRLRYGAVGTIAIDLFEWEFEVDITRADDEIIGERWLHATKTGGRDHRYNRNHLIQEVRRHGVQLTFDDLQWHIELYAYDNACTFANALSAMSGQGPAFFYSDDDEDARGTWENAEDEPGWPDEREEEQEVRDWHDVLGTPADASVDTIRAAYRERLKGYHPDRVAHLGEKLRKLANEEAVAINQAYAEAMQQRR